MEREKKTLSPIMVDAKGLQEITGLGRKRAIELAEKAGARVTLGIRRNLYNVQALQYYINKRTGGDS